MFFERYSKFDPMNTNKSRNIKNADKYEYNCAWYALGCYSWYCPFTFHNNNLNENVKQILKDFSNVRIISSEKDLKEKEYMIAFRLSKHDFHFMKRAKNGHWFQKMGGTPKINKVSKTKVFSDIWSPYRYDGGYDSEIVFFAVKE